MRNILAVNKKIRYILYEYISSIKYCLLYYCKSFSSNSKAHIECLSVKNTHIILQTK